METRIDPERFVEMVQAIYRLFRVATFHHVDNEAVGRAIETCRHAMREFAAEGQGLTLLFARDTVIVNGQLLQAPPDVYELAMEFGQFLTVSGRNSFYIGAEVDDPELRVLLAFFRERRAGSDDVELEHEPDKRGFLTPNIRLRWIRDELLVGLEDPRLSAFERVMLTYALAARVIRRLLDEVSGIRPEIPSFFKRVARQLALVDYASRPRVLDVTVGQHDGRDPARVGVDSAIVATAMARRLTRDERVLARVALTAMTLDLGEERAKVPGLDGVNPFDPMSTAVMHLRSGRLRSDAIDRTAVAWEARSLLARSRAMAVYQQHLYPSLEGFLVATARRFVEYLASTSGDDTLPIDRAVEHVREHADTDAGLICADLLVAALTLIPRGTPVRLESGHEAIVVAAAVRPSEFELPSVVVVLGPDGDPVEPMTVDLAADASSRARYGGVEQVISDPCEVLVGVVERIPGGRIELEWRKRREAAIAHYRDRLAVARGDTPKSATAEEPSSDATTQAPSVSSTAETGLQLESSSTTAAGPARERFERGSWVAPTGSPPPVADDARESPSSRSQSRTPVDPASAVESLPELIFNGLDAPEPASSRSQEWTPIGGSDVIPDEALPPDGRAQPGPTQDIADVASTECDIDAPNAFVREALGRRMTGAQRAVAADSSDVHDRGAGSGGETSVPSADGGVAAGSIMRRRRRTTGTAVAVSASSGAHGGASTRAESTALPDVGERREVTGPQSVVAPTTDDRFRAAARRHQVDTSELEALMRDYVSADFDVRPTTAQVDAVVAEHASTTAGLVGDVDRSGDDGPRVGGSATTSATSAARRPRQSTGVRRIVDDFEDVPDAAFEAVDDDT